MKWWILLFGVASNAGASVLVKFAMMPPREFPSLSDPIKAIGNWPFWMGLALYGIAFLLYAAALARLPLSVAHPILTAGAIACVAFASAFIFNDSFPMSKILGVGLIIAGVALITTSTT